MVIMLPKEYADKVEGGVFRPRTQEFFENFEVSASGLWVPPGTEKRLPTGIDLFSGIGGFSLGFLSAGYRLVAAVDNEAYAMLTYLFNLGSPATEIHFIEPADEKRFKTAVTKQKKLHKTMTKEIPELPDRFKDLIWGNAWHLSNPQYPPVPHVFFGDICKLTGEQLLAAIGMKRGEVDCVMGGPPCQGFSIGNTKRTRFDFRNSLVFEFCRMVLEIQPKTMVMENVPEMVNMLTPEGLPVIDAICRVLSDGGFAPYDALKKSLLTTAGAGGALQGQERPGKRKTGKKLEKPGKPAQLSFPERKDSLE